MSDVPQGPGWWLASDHNWYPPEQHSRTSSGPGEVPEGFPRQAAGILHASSDSVAGKQKVRGSLSRLWDYTLRLGYLIAVVLFGIGLWFAFVPFKEPNWPISCGSALSGSYIKGGPSWLYPPCVSGAHYRLIVTAVVVVVAVLLVVFIRMQVRRRLRPSRPYAR
jgi:hypothetical protein